MFPHTHFFTCMWIPCRFLQILTQRKRVFWGVVFTIVVLWQISQFRSFGKWLSILCLPKSTFARGSEGNSFEEQEASRCSGTLSPTRPCLNCCSHSGRSWDPIVIDVFLQHYIQGCICCSGNVDTFPRSLQFDRGFHVRWTRNLSYLHHHTTMNLEVGLKKIRLILLEGYLAPLLGLFDPYQSGSSQNLISSSEFYRSICDWEYELFTTHRR